MARPGPDAVRALAGEYVLGTLRGRARARFEALAARDAAVGDEVRRWEAFVTPLAGRVPAVEPPARVWRRIEARIGARRSAWSSLSFWRAFGLVVGGLASVLLTAFLWLTPQPGSQPMFLAVLTSADAAPRIMVTMESRGMLRVHTMKPWPRVQGKSLELWAMPEHGPPRSLGLVPNADAEMTMPLAPDDPRVRGVRMLAVSVEPMGGSPMPHPTGPVLCSGPVVALQHAA